MIRLHCWVVSTIPTLSVWQISKTKQLYWDVMNGVTSHQHWLVNANQHSIQKGSNQQFKIYYKKVKGSKRVNDWCSSWRYLSFLGARLILPVKLLLLPATCIVLFFNLTNVVPRLLFLNCWCWRFLCACTPVTVICLSKPVLSLYLWLCLCLQLHLNNKKDNNKGSIFHMCKLA